MTPWGGAPADTLEAARAHAGRIGYPVVIKPASGAGGRGIRVVETPDRLGEAYLAARDEALKLFGDDTVFVERWLAGARHIEVQVAADRVGTTWAVDLRECSVQRLHQKLLEESPALGLSAEGERTLRSAAVRLCQAAGYQNLATVEFLLDSSGRHASLMEVNPRLQVEHAVTELTTGLDLVQMQIHLARGGRLEGTAPEARGHAIGALPAAAGLRTASARPTPHTPRRCRGLRCRSERPVLNPSMKRLSVLIAVATVDMMGLMMVAPLMPFYALRFDAPEWMVGPLISAFAMAQLVSSPIWGRVSDRKGRRPALRIGLAAAGMAFLIFGFAQSLWGLFLSRVVQGLGGGTTGVAQAYVADTMAPSDRAKALGWLSAGTSAGVVIGPFLGSFAATWGPAAPGVVAAAVMLVNFVAASYWLPESRGARTSGTALAEPHTPRPVGRAVWEIVRHPSRPAHRVIWIYCVGMLALNALIGVLALVTYLPMTSLALPRLLGY